MKMNNNDYLENFLLEKEQNEERSQATINSYRSDLAQFLEFVQKDIQELTKADTLAYKRMLKKIFNQVNTRNRKIVALRQFLLYLQDEYNMLSEIPVGKIKLEKVQGKKQRSIVFTEKTFADIVRSVKKANNYKSLVLLYTLRYTGIRVSELQWFTRDKIKNDTITVIGKGDKTRDVFIPKFLQRMFREYVKRYPSRPDNPYLFQGRPEIQQDTTRELKERSISRSRVHNIMKDYAEKAGITEVKSHAHALRHLFVVENIKVHGIEKTAIMVGHSDIKTTQGYNTISEAELIQDMNEASNEQYQQHKQLMRDRGKQEKQKKKRGRPKKRKTRRKK